MVKKLIVQLDTDELTELIDNSIQKALAKIPKESKNGERELMTRSDVALLFKVSLATVNAWCNNGKLIRHRMNSRVYFFKDEVMAELSKRKK